MEDLREQIEDLILDATSFDYKNPRRFLYDSQVEPLIEALLKLVERGE